MVLLVGLDENKRCELKVDTLQILFYLSNESDFHWNHSSGISGILLFFCLFILVCRCSQNKLINKEDQKWTMTTSMNIRQVIWATNRVEEQFQTDVGGDSVEEKGAYHKYQRGWTSLLSSHGDLQNWYKTRFRTFASGEP